MNQQLQDYIKKQRESGFSYEEMRRELLKAGWTEADINEGLKDDKVVPVPPQPQASVSEQSATHAPQRTWVWVISALWLTTALLGTWASFFITLVLGIFSVSLGRLALEVVTLIGMILALKIAVNFVTRKTYIAKKEIRTIVLITALIPIVGTVFLNIISLTTSDQVSLMDFGLSIVSTIIYSGVLYVLATRWLNEKSVKQLSAPRKKFKLSELIALSILIVLLTVLIVGVSLLIIGLKQALQ